MPQILHWHARQDEAFETIRKPPAQRRQILRLRSLPPEATRSARRKRDAACGQNRHAGAGRHIPRGEARPKVAMRPWCNLPFPASHFPLPTSRLQPSSATHRRRGSSRR